MQNNARLCLEVGVRGAGGTSAEPRGLRLVPAVPGFKEPPSTPAAAQPWDPSPAHGASNRLPASVLLMENISANQALGESLPCCAWRSEYKPKTLASFSFPSYFISLFLENSSIVPQI